MKSYSDFLKETKQSVISHEFLNEDVREITFTFGRFNPPTRGHGYLFNQLRNIAEDRNYLIFTSQTQDKKKNPLSYDEKIQFAREMFPTHARNIVKDTSIKTIFDVLVRLFNRGYEKINLVVGDDRIQEMRQLIIKYNGVESGHGYYYFDDDQIKVMSSGERDPDGSSDNISSISASRARKAAANNDFNDFQTLFPSNFDNTIGLFKLLRRKMGLNEFFTPKIDIKSKIEENCELEEGQLVNVKNKNIQESIHFIGPNYVILNNGKRYWKNDVEAV